MKHIITSEYKFRLIKLLVFGVALIFNLIYIYLNSEILPQKITNDGAVYHRYALNISHGNGYSFDYSLPYEKSYYREPGYPFFIAGIFRIFELSGREILPLNEREFRTCNIELSHPEIFFVYFVQAIVGAITILLIFMLLKEINLGNISIFIALGCVLYFPAGMLTAKLLRETLQVFLTVVLLFFLIKDYKKSDYLNLVIAGICTGLNILVFQVNYTLLLFLLMFFILTQKNFLVIIKKSIIVGIFTLLIIVPWFYKVYNYYSDCRVSISAGSYLTSQRLAYKNAINMSYDLNYLKLSDKNALLDQYFSGDSRIKFEYSYNGYYKSRTKALTSIIPVSEIFKYKFKKYYSNVIQSLYNFYVGPSSLFLGKHIVLKGFLYFIYSVVLIFAVWGVIKFRIKILLLIPFFIGYLILIPVIGNEGRRTIYMQLNIIIFAIIGFVDLLNSYLFKYKKISIFNEE